MGTKPSPSFCSFGAANNDEGSQLTNRLNMFGWKCQSWQQHRVIAPILRGQDPTHHCHQQYFRAGEKPTWNWHHVSWCREEEFKDLCNTPQRHKRLYAVEIPHSERTRQLRSQKMSSGHGNHKSKSGSLPGSNTTSGNDAAWHLTSAAAIYTCIQSGNNTESGV